MPTQIGASRFQDNDMLVARDSRRHRRGQQADILDRLTRILRRLADLASGRHHRRVKPGRHRHRTSAPRVRSYALRETGVRRAWLVKRDISAWRLGIVVCVLLALLWVGWRIVAQTAALSLA